MEILETSFEGRFRFVLKTAADTVNDGGAYPVIYLDSFVVENIDDESDNNFATSGVNFTDANELLLRDKINLNPLSWRIFAGSPTTTFTVDQKPLVTSSLRLAPSATTYIKPLSEIERWLSENKS